MKEIKSNKINPEKLKNDEVEEISNKNNIKNVKKRFKINLEQDKFEKLRDKDREEDDEDFLKIKKKTKAIEKIFEENKSKVLPEISDSKLKKIKLDGYYGGLNKIFFDKDGIIIFFFNKLNYYLRQGNNSRRV